MTERWDLARRLLEQGADSSAAAPEELLKAYRQRTSTTSANRERWENWDVPDAVIPAMTLAVLLLDHGWEVRHAQQRDNAWRSGPGVNGARTLDQDPAVKALLDAFVPPGSPWPVCCARVPRSKPGRPTPCSASTSTRRILWAARPRSTGPCVG